MVAASASTTAAGSSPLEGTAALAKAFEAFASADDAAAPPAIFDVSWSSRDSSLSLCVSISIYLCLSVSIYLSICLSICLSLSIYQVSICLSRLTLSLATSFPPLPCLSGLACL